MPGFSTSRSCRLAAAGCLAALLGLLPGLGRTAHAQKYHDPEGIYQPLHQGVPPGVAGYWTTIGGKGAHLYFQPVRIELPSSGAVTVYHGPARQPVGLTAPAQVGMAVGHLYRLRIGDMPEFPGVELYPSVEVLDHLHPPAGRMADFPVPLQLTAEEIEFALEGRMITKVMYLERPQLAFPGPLEHPIPVLELPPVQNLLAEADRAGRPMLILRLGGRAPTGQAEDAAFYGSGAPVALPQPVAR